ncbi:host cell division inhibitor Icd-like protein [Escherichia coli]|nr:host cell division inhibitor Icd-like protein [Escherichia coli]EJE2938463.1 host cell division inhibitor Icd-like protein [Escherichia coli]EJE2944796.1 host cell division inhibitor Icd-like protein [Escherichia coli]EJE3993825.1 host cell division inhibitor Icd-like protein [Escherichia coli]EJL8168102.1 host cell division inhibitor Icd-like protein [Escherichia coli]
MNTGYAPVQGRGFVRPGETEKPQNWCFSGIKKAAPIMSRLSEQLTCCEKNGSVQGNYINRVAKRHNCRITGKTKATRYGGPSTLIARYPQRKRADYYAVITSGWQCDQCAGLLVGYSCSLALRRWRRLISPRMAVTINCASVSFSSLTKFISLKTSRGILAVFCCDLLLVVPVGITGLLTVRWRSVYVEKKIKKGLKCKSPKSSIILKGDLHLKDKAPQVSLPLAGLLTTNDSNSIEVAMRNHNTHPQGRDSHNLNKYIWRFIALSTAQPRVITIEATSEQEARQQSPAGCVMIFAARIRQEVHHVQ